MHVVLFISLDSFFLNTFEICWYFRLHQSFKRLPWTNIQDYPLFPCQIYRVTDEALIAEAVRIVRIVLSFTRLNTPTGVEAYHIIDLHWF